MRLERRDLAVLGVALVVAGGCIRLGVWQLDRLAQRHQRNAARAAARDRSLLALPARGLPADSLRDRHLHAQGVYDYARERLWHGRSYQGIPGVDLITPLRLADGSAILVDRGWVPSPDGYHVDAQAYREPDSAEVEGFGSAAPRARGDVDPARVADSLPYRLLPVVLEAAPADELPSPMPPSTPTTPPAPPRGALPRRWPPMPLSAGPHLAYAIQWFSFALIALLGSLALVRKGREAGLRPRPQPPGYQ